jgi:hypothetical protein
VLGKLYSWVESVPYRQISDLVLQGLFDAGKGYDHAGPLSFQAALLDSLNLQLLLPIESEHYSHFDTIWAASGLEAAGDDRLRWRRLGFKTERPQSEFEETGLLGLKVLTRLASDHKDEFAAVRPPSPLSSHTNVFPLVDYQGSTNSTHHPPVSPRPSLLHRPPRPPLPLRPPSSSAPPSQTLRMPPYGSRLLCSYLGRVGSGRSGLRKSRQFDEERG